MPNFIKEANKIANRLDLRRQVDPVTKDLYGYAEPVLDEAAMRRAFVAYWTKAHGVHTLTPAIIDEAICVFRARCQ
jgi:hypothetical protein